MKSKKIITSLLTALMLIQVAIPSVLAQEAKAATRGEVVRMLLNQR